MEVVTTDNIIAKKKDNGLYEFYLDTDPNNLLYYVYIIDTTKIDLVIDNYNYKI